MNPVICSFQPVFTAFTNVVLKTGWSHYNDDILKIKSVSARVPKGGKRNRLQAEDVSVVHGIVNIPESDNWTFLLGTLMASRTGNVHLSLGVQNGGFAGGFDFAVNGERVFQTLNSAWKALDGVTYGTCPVAFRVHKGENLVVLRFRGVSGVAKFAWQFLTAGEYENLQLTAENVKKPSDDRILNLERVNFAVDSMRADVFEKFDCFCNMPAGKLRKTYRQYPILKMYDGAMEKILAELPATVVPDGQVVAWHLYNMGYVFKTKDSCFAIDIHHRRATLLEPFLDFILITHNHGDHFNMGLLHKMAGHGKFVISNFFPARGYGRSPRSLDIGNIHIEIETADHNSTLVEFMNLYRITCGKGADAPVIYDSGDCCNHLQLNPSGPVDCHICHPRVGLDEVAAAERIHPRQIWFSHLWEMGHCIPSIWRPVTPYDISRDIARLTELNNPAVPVIPLWGERFVLKHG